MACQLFTIIKEIYEYWKEALKKQQVLELQKQNLLSHLNIQLDIENEQALFQKIKEVLKEMRQQNLGCLNLEKNFQEQLAVVKALTEIKNLNYGHITQAYDGPWKITYQGFYQVQEIEIPKRNRRKPLIQRKILYEYYGEMIDTASHKFYKGYWQNGMRQGWGIEVLDASLFSPFVGGNVGEGPYDYEGYICEGLWVKNKFSGIIGMEMEIQIPIVKLNAPN